MWAEAGVAEEDFLDREQARWVMRRAASVQRRSIEVTSSTDLAMRSKASVNDRASSRPLSVRRTPRPVRSNSATRSDDSSVRIWRLMAPWVRCNSRAARVMLSRRAAASTRSRRRAAMFIGRMGGAQFSAISATDGLRASGIGRVTGFRSSSSESSVSGAIPSLNQPMNPVSIGLSALSKTGFR